MGRRCRSREPRQKSMSGIWCPHFRALGAGPRKGGRCANRGKRARRRVRHRRRHKAVGGTGGTNGQGRGPGYQPGYARSRPTRYSKSEHRMAGRQGYKMPLADATFDAVVCQQGLQFFPEKPAALSEMRRASGAAAALRCPAGADRTHSGLSRAPAGPGSPNRSRKGGAPPFSWEMQERSEACDRWRAPRGQAPCRGKDGSLPIRRALGQGRGGWRADHDGRLTGQGEGALTPQ